MGSGISTDKKEEQSKELKAALEMIISNNDLSKLIEQTVQDLNSLMKPKLDIAITGVTCTGKSSLVNALRGIQNGEEGAAETGIIETTKEKKGYQHCTFPNVTIWDLPGIGTPEFQAKDYLQMVHFTMYDFFIIAGSVRFTENDALLAREIHKMKKKFYYVRNKLDIEVESERRKAKGRNETFSEENTLEKIRKNCCDNLAKAGEGHSRVFLVSSHYWSRYDFPDLLKAMGTELDKLQRYALIKAASKESKEILRKKKAAMGALIEKVALLSSATGAVPVPGLSLVCDIPFLEARMKDFSRGFGLDEVSLHQLARQVGKPFPVLSSAIKKTRLANQIDTEFVKSLLSRMCKHGGWERSFLDFILNLFGKFNHFAVIFRMLQCFLDDVQEDALNVLEGAFEN